MTFPFAVLGLAAFWVAWAASASGLGWLVYRRALPGAVWFGLAGITAVSMMLALVSPLGAWWTRVVIALFFAAGLVAVAVSGMWRAWKVWLVVAASGMGFALLASVEPSNYDTGLYHIGSIFYARDGGTVLGLANLHERFGFSSSMWPLSAALGLALADGNEIRLVNGLLVIAALMDVGWRVFVVRKFSVGTYVLSAGLLLIAGAVVQYPGRLIASSAQDTAAAILILVSGAYLADFLVKRADRASASVAILTAALAGAMRPLGWVFLAATILVIASRVEISGWRRRWVFLAPATLGALILTALTLVRDVLTSGWLLFPVSAFPLPVDWRYPDPSPAAADIAAWARTPFGSTPETLANWDWFGDWLMRLPTDWSIPALIALLGVSVAWLLVSSRARETWRGNWRLVVWAEIPVLATLVVWFLGAPDPRFAWGLVLLVGLIPLGVLAAGLAKRTVWWTGMAAVGLGLVVLAVLRGAVNSVSWNLQPPPTASTEVSQLSDGTEVLVPSGGGDQCWSTFPLCRPWYASPQVSLRGETWREGFLPN